MNLIKFIIIIFIYFLVSIKANSNEQLINQLKEGGNLIFIRHAYAPGNGDPINFDFDEYFIYGFQEAFQIQKLPKRNQSSRNIGCRHNIFHELLFHQKSNL